MRMKKLIRKWIPGLLAAALLFAPVRVYAAGEPIVDNGNGEITIVYQDRNHIGIEDMQVRIYRVASVTGETRTGTASGYHVQYHVTPAFARFDENSGSPRITGFSEAALNEALKIREGESDAQRRARWQSIASSLAQYAPLPAYGITPDGDALTAVDGTVNFTGLSPGLYLLIADAKIVEEAHEDYQYSYDPTFVALPGYAGGVWDYSADLDFNDNNASLRPKYRYDRVPNEIEVHKRWVGDAADIRPDGIVVDIYRDGVLYMTVTLNEANGWRYRWDAGRRHVWRIVERTVLQEYSVSIIEQKWTGYFILTNTYTPPPPPPPPDNPPPPETPPEEPDVLGADREDPAILGVRRGDIPDVLGARRLPQTGQLWWPVPLLAIGGTGLFGAGVIRRKRSKE
ncbi:MAG: Cna B-type domain-containing protein [Lachnospiraceae bacterium]|nr:Cna B-type domain-containing protein [Lachnospiraceae bacterium]